VGLKHDKRSHSDTTRNRVPLDTEEAEPGSKGEGGRNEDITIQAQDVR